jgi:hypothetical protein
VFEFEKMRDGTARAPFVSGGMEALIGVSAAEVMKDVRRYFATVLPRMSRPMLPTSTARRPQSAIIVSRFASATR